MKKRYTLAALALAFSLAASLSHPALSRAHAISGAELYKLLSKPQNSESFQCGAYYVHGVADGLQGVTLDIPGNVTRGQLTQIVLAYMKKHPKDKKLPAEVLVRNALMEKYPVKRQR